MCIIYDSICKQQLIRKECCSTFSKASHFLYAFHWQLTARNDTSESVKEETDIMMKHKLFLKKFDNIQKSLPRFLSFPLLSIPLYFNTFLKCNCVLSPSKSSVNLSYVVYHDSKLKIFSSEQYSSIIYIVPEQNNSIPKHQNIERET